MHDRDGPALGSGMTGTRYPMRIGRRSALFLRILFGVTPGKAWAMIGDGQVSAQFGWYRISTPIANIDRWRIEGPWRWITAIGVRMGIRRHDLSFAGSPRGGVRLDVREPVQWSIFRVPAVYLGVDDLDGFAAALARHGIPGEDARRA